MRDDVGLRVASTMPLRPPPSVFGLEKPLGTDSLESPSHSLSTSLYIPSLPYIDDLPQCVRFAFSITDPRLTARQFPPLYLRHTFFRSPRSLWQSCRNASPGQHVFTESPQQIPCLYHSTSSVTLYCLSRRTHAIEFHERITRIPSAAVFLS